MENKSYDDQLFDNKVKQNYQAYMDDFTIGNNFHKQLLKIPDERRSQRASRKAFMRQFSLVAASICVLVVCIGVLGPILIPRGGSDCNNAKSDSAPVSTKSAEAAASPFQEDASNNKASEAVADADFPVTMTGEDTSTYTQFVSVYEPSGSSASKPQGSLNKNENTASDSTNSGKRIPEDKLLGKLPQKLLKSQKLASKTSAIVNEATTLSCEYNIATDTTSGRLAVNVHPVFDFEMDQLVSTENKQQYSLDLKENPGLPDSVSEYENTLLYPVFPADTLSKEAIASRVHTVNGTTTISFGVYENGYVITYDALGLTANTLADYILQ